MIIYSGKSPHLSSESVHEKKAGKGECSGVHWAQVSQVKPTGLTKVRESKILLITCHQDQSHRHQVTNRRMLQT